MGQQGRTPPALDPGSAPPPTARADRGRTSGCPGRARAARASLARIAGTSPRARSSGGRALRSHPSRMNSVASQSSSSGCVGGSPCVPKSAGVATIPRAEILFPDPVHDHARGQGIVRGHQPAREPKPVQRLALGGRVQRRRQSGLHRLAFAQEAPALEHVRLARLGQLLHDGSKRNRPLVLLRVRSRRRQSVARGFQFGRDGPVVFPECCLLGGPALLRRDPQQAGDLRGQRRRGGGVRGRLRPRRRRGRVGHKRAKGFRLPELPRGGDARSRRRLAPFRFTVANHLLETFKFPPSGPAETRARSGLRRPDPRRPCC